VELVEESDGLTVCGLWHLAVIDKANVEGARLASRCQPLGLG
jgi:hypothetical protein